VEVRPGRPSGGPARGLLCAGERSVTCRAGVGPLSWRFQRRQPLGL